MINVTPISVNEDENIDWLQLTTLIGVIFTSLVALVQIILKTPCQSSCFQGCFWYDGTTNQELNDTHGKEQIDHITIIMPENSSHVENHSAQNANGTTTTVQHGKDGRPSPAPSREPSRESGNHSRSQ